MGAGPGKRQGKSIKGKLSSKGDAPLPPPADDDISFSSMAAGPDAGTRSKRSVKGRLGSKARAKKSVKVEKKTAADFVAEGIVDDADDVNSTVEEIAAAALALEEPSAATADAAKGSLDVQDIRFGVGDVADPFLVEQKRTSAARSRAVEEEDELAVGKAMDVTGDGGVLKRLVAVGRGSNMPSGATVKVRYSGALADGTVFDSTADDGFEFVLGTGKVIKGWEAGVATMKLGEKAVFDIAPRYAYGRRGMPPTIPSNATLTFTIEVVSVAGGSDANIKTVAEFNPEIARSPADIARDYGELLETQEERKKNMSLFDRFYIISPFASQTGKQPPWILNPRITFVLIFAIVGVAFYLVFLSGAIHQGIPDETGVDVNIFK